MIRLLSLDGDGHAHLSEFHSSIPDYAVLSHTWGNDSDEVTYRDIMDRIAESKNGFQKIQFCGRQASKDNLDYFWVDTCCIDKSSSAELSEAIHSMFQWYRNSVKCYAYLTDISIDDTAGWELSFQKSRWFTRGWTLQELIAPSSLEFYSKEGIRFGSKNSLERQIVEITGIDIEALRGTRDLSTFHPGEKLSWAEKRQTKREEDRSYCLLGIFDVSLPLIYGEGRAKAFKRLWKEIAEGATSQDVLSSVRNNEAQAAEALIAARVRVDAVDGAGFTSLMYASQNGNEILINSICQGVGVEINKQSHAGHTALMRAVIMGRLQAVRVLLKHRPHLEIKDNVDKRSALFHALDYAEGDPNGESSVSNHWAIATVLLDAGCDVETTDAKGFRPLHWFCSTGKYAAVKWLIEAKANVNARRDDKGWTPLMDCAACRRDVQGACLAMGLLLDAGADPSFHSQAQSYTALCKAAQLGHFKQAEILLVKGKANANVMTHSGRSPLAEASLHGWSNIVELLLKHGAYVNPRETEDRTPLILACMNRSGILETVEILIQNGANVSAYNQTGWTPLDEACYRNHVAIARALLRSDVDPNRRNSVPGERQGWTSLMHAAAQGHLEACKLMCEEGNADVGVRNANGETAEHLASGYDAVQEYLAGRKSRYSPITNFHATL